ncbi:MAG: hypothetical protein NC938_02920 [Candidatus Omnitrophica bacterium]|nr:hypothetical protein [Candidatus Omnitrophota bacterium]
MNLKTFLLTWGMILVGVIMNVLGMYFVKMRMNELGAIELTSVKAVTGYFLSLVMSPLALVGLILFLLAPLPSAIALSRMELSIAYPLSIALSCLIIVPLASIFFGEIVNMNKILAIVMIIASLYFMYKV